MAWRGLEAAFFAMLALALVPPSTAGPRVSMDDPALMESLKSHVVFLVKVPGYRTYRNPEAQARVVGYIEARFKEIGLAVERQEFPAGGQIYANVIGRLNTGMGRIIVVGAHYDVCEDQPGADDNASGVAGLIELARMVKARAGGVEGGIPREIQFVAYANEEPPFFGTESMGSFVHAERLHQAKARVDYMVALEMIGYFTEAEDSQEYPLPTLKWIYPSRGNFIAVVSNYPSGAIRRRARDAFNRRTRIPCHSLSAPASVTGVDFSDHRNYWKFGYKAIMITDTAFFRNPNYHRATDTMDTLDFGKMAEVVKGLAHLLAEA